MNTSTPLTIGKIAYFALAAVCTLYVVANSTMNTDLFFHREYQERKWKQKLSDLWENQDRAKTAAAYCILELEKRRRTLDIELAQSRLLYPEFASIMEEVRAEASNHMAIGCQLKQKSYQESIVLLNRAKIEYATALKNGL